MWPVGTIIITWANKDGNPAHGVLHAPEGFCLVRQKLITFAGTRTRLTTDYELIEHAPAYQLVGNMNDSYTDVKAAYDQWVAEENPAEPLLVASWSPAEWREKGRRPMCGPPVSIANADDWQRLQAAIDNCDQDHILEIRKIESVYGISSVGCEVKATPLYSDADRS